ncbi:replication initiator protein [Dipodfec virus UOA04_Rod_880]|nr:replication initiator protein [Dipodfec virus UOA04_Rod_880]
MCLNPIHTAEGDFKCRSCAECLLEKKNDYLLRCLCESKTSHYYYMVTLTYDNDHVADFYKVNKSGKDDSQIFLQKFRENYIWKRFGKDFYFKYLIVSEQGDEHNRPHWHAIFFTKRRLFGNLGAYFNSNFALNYWQKGFVRVDKCKSSKALSYCCKYLYKSINDYSVNNCKSLIFDENLQRFVKVEAKERYFNGLTSDKLIEVSSKGAFIHNMDYQELLTGCYKFPIVKPKLRCSQNLGWEYISTRVEHIKRCNDFSILIGTKSNGEKVSLQLSNYYFLKIFPYPLKDAFMRPLLMLYRWLISVYPRCKTVFEKESEYREISYVFHTIFCKRYDDALPYMRVRYPECSDYRQLYNSKVKEISEYFINRQTERDHKNHILSDKHKRNIDIKFEHYEMERV